MIYIIRTSHSRTGRIVAFAAACGLLAAGILAYSRIELAPLRYDVIGVDVSNHQGDIDWRALAGSGIGFAYIKATEGETFRDGRFPDNWAGAELAGVPRGAYHFFTRCRTGADQARNFIATVPRDAAALPHVVDAEQMGPCRSGPTVGDIPQEIDAFLALVEAHHGRRPLAPNPRRHRGRPSAEGTGSPLLPRVRDGLVQCGRDPPPPRRSCWCGAWSSARERYKLTEQGRAVLSALLAAD